MSIEEELNIEANLRVAHEINPKLKRLTQSVGVPF
jgi:hypothetical protein